MKRFVWVVLSLTTACREAPTAPVNVTTPPERWVKVRSAAAAPSLEVPARVLPGPASVAVVTAPLRATVVKVRARAGDVVEANAPLVDVVMPEVLDAAGRVEGARVRLAAWNERLAQLTSLRTEGLARSLEVSEAAARVAESQAELQAARAVLLAAGLREDAAAGLLKGAGVVSLRAPIGGVVTQVQATLGEGREPSSGPLVALSSAGPNRVEARFPRPVPTGGAFEFVAPEGRFAATLVAAAPAADPHDGAYLAWFETAQPVVAGALGRVLAAGAGSPRFLVDAAAIVRTAGVTGVTTRSATVPVEVLRCEAAECVVSGALHEGDDVVVGR